MKSCTIHRRKIIFSLFVFIFLLFVLHSIMVQGNNLHLRTRNIEILISNLRKSAISLPRTIVRKLYKTNDQSDQEEFLNRTSSVSDSKLVDIAHNSSNILDMQLHTLLRVKEIMNGTYLANHNTSKPNTVREQNTPNPFSNVDMTSTFQQHKPENKNEKQLSNNINSSRLADIGHNSSNVLDAHVDTVLRVKELMNGTNVANYNTSKTNTVEKQNISQPFNNVDRNATFQQDKPENRNEKQLSDGKRLKWKQSYNKMNNTLEFRQQIYKDNFRQVRNQADIDCKEIIEDNESAILKAKQIMKDVGRRAIPVERYAKDIDCERFRIDRGYIDHPLSQMELDFPIAFAIAAYKDVEQVERLLRAIYRPHNMYCFHLDIKMLQIERTAIEHISSCFDNVIITDKSVNVTWGNFTVLEAELLCMEILWQYKKWKYYINLTGQEFPLKTNREIVAILNAFKGANLVDGTAIRSRENYMDRWSEAGTPPHKIRPIKGSIHVAINRHFVDFALHDQISLDFLDWLKKTHFSDETFFPTLNHSPQFGINGSFLGEAEEYPLKPQLTRYKNWDFGHSVFARHCAGKYLRNICILGVGDLHKAYNDIGLFANKFILGFEYLALDCLEEILYQKTWDQYLNDEDIDTNYYEHLDYVKYKLFVPPN